MPWLNYQEIGSRMKLVLKAYHKNKGLFKDGDYVKPVSSSSPKKEIDAFLLEKLKHESLKGNYSKSELEYIEKHLSVSPEYATAKKNEGKFDWTIVLGIVIALLLLVVVIFLVKKFFGWIVFFAVLGLIGFPLSQKTAVPNRNVAISVVLIGVWLAVPASDEELTPCNCGAIAKEIAELGRENLSSAKQSVADSCAELVDGNEEFANAVRECKEGSSSRSLDSNTSSRKPPSKSSVCSKGHSQLEIEKRFRTIGSRVIYKQYLGGQGCQHAWHYSVIESHGNSVDCFPKTDGSSGKVEIIQTSCEVN